MLKNFDNFLNESEDELEQTYIFATEKEARSSRALVGFMKKGFVDMPDGYEHIFIEQFENSEGDIARLVWLGNVRPKGMKWHEFPHDKWQITIIKPGHKNYEKAKKLKL